MKPVDQRLREAILHVVEQQIRDREPAVTRKTFDRLCREGLQDDEAKRLIGYVVASEFFEVVREGRRYDERTFAARLKALPRLPWNGDPRGEGQPEGNGSCSMAS